MAVTIKLGNNETSYTTYNLGEATVEQVKSYITTNLYSSYYDDYYGDICELNGSYLKIEGTSVLTNSDTLESMFAYAGEYVYTIDLSDWIITGNNITCSLYKFFCGLVQAYTLNIPQFNNVKITNLSNIFYECNKLKTTNITELDTSNVTDMSCMFSRCLVIASLNLSNFDTHNVVNMRDMFYYCTELVSLNISSFDTSSVTNMYGMFYCCGLLTSLNLSNFNTHNVTNMGYMFYSCKKLSNVNVTSFNTENVAYMYSMFTYCDSLVTLDLSSFDTKSITDCSGMFFTSSTYHTTVLKTIYASEKFVIPSGATQDRMFTGCTALIGAISYNSSKVSGAYANYTTGYFTYRTQAIKRMYIGVNGTAKKVSKLYIGVNGAPRLVKQVYIGVNGVPKLIYKC